MTVNPDADSLVAIFANERATPSLVYRSLLKSIHEGRILRGAKLPNERDLARQLNASRTAVRAALQMMERQGLISRRVGSGTFLTTQRLDEKTVLGFDHDEYVDQVAWDVHPAFRPRGKAADAWLKQAFEELVGAKGT